MNNMVLRYIAAACTVIAGIIHLSLVHPAHGSLSNIAIFFLVAGILQLFWIIPTVKVWNRIWNYVGCGGTAALIIIWTITRMPNPITTRALPVNEMSIVEESAQAAFIVLTMLALRKYNSK